MRLLKKIFIMLFLVSNFIFISNVNISANSNSQVSLVELRNISTLNNMETIGLTIKLNYDTLENSSFYEENQTYLLDSNLYNQNLEISNISPFAFKIFNSYNDYISNKSAYINALEEGYVDYIIVEKRNKYIDDNAAISNTTTGQTMTIDDAKELMCIDGSSYTGNGVKIGVIESGIPKITTNFSNGCIVDSFTYFNGTDEMSTLHSTAVNSIISGTYGIAPGADIYLATFNPLSINNTLDKVMEWLINKNVDVINISNTSSTINSQGLYNGDAAYIDYISWFYNMPIVKSSGNNEEEEELDNLITNPGMGLNVITVGAVNSNKILSEISSFEVSSELESLIYKPTLVAPGEKISIPNSGYDNETIVTKEHSGTSYAAPMVTGTIALLMEEFPFVKENTSMLISSLITGAEILPYNSNMWNSNSGAGLINYDNSKAILGNSLNYYGEISTVTSQSELVISRIVTISPQQSLEFSLVNIFSPNDLDLISENSGYPIFTKYKIVFYNLDGSIFKTFYSNGNILLGSIINSSIETKSYELKVFIDGYKMNKSIEKISLSMFENEHIHNYNSNYIAVDRTGHNSYCSCGNYVKRPHAISASFTNERYVDCIQCGYELDMYFDVALVGPQSSTIIYRTSNGSYILPNGIIVLVDEDIENYLNGNLVFNNQV